MNYVLENPVRALLTGLILAALCLGVWLATGAVDGMGVVSVLFRFIHVAAAMVWIGFVFFVNFVQLAALAEADEAGRAAIARSIVPRVAAGFRHASHLTVLTGVLLLAPTGYVLGEWAFGSAVFLGPARSLMLWLGALGGLLMWAFVHFVIAPNLRIVLGQTSADAGRRESARLAVARFARINLVLALPVTFAMIAAAHL